ncbi:MAG TPA: protein phosphatase [Armatimonadota bacterium]|jgi:hypothetical protein
MVDPSKKSGTNAETPQVPFSRSYWVDPGRLLAGCYPGAPDAVKAREKLSGLLECGIGCVVSLMFENETDNQGNPFMQYEDELAKLAAERGLSVICVRKSIRDMDIPTQAFMVEVLDCIDDMIENEVPVYVHCWGGMGRTGTVVGCWLARHGIALDDAALRLVQYLRRNDSTSHRSSPQTSAQCEMVRLWLEGQ